MIRLRTILFSLLLASPFASALADDYADTLKLFRGADGDATFFRSSYGYAVFPTIGKGGMVLGAAHGSGRVYVKGKHVGETSMTQVTVGPQLGGQAYSQIIFLQNKRAFDEFASGDFERALDAYRTAEEVDPGDGGIRVNAALAYYRLGKLPEARSKFKEATQLNASLAAQYGAFAKLLGN